MIRPGQTSISSRFIALSMFLSSIFGSQAAARDMVTALVPAFSGDIDLGRGAAHALKLQLQSKMASRDSSRSCADGVGGAARSRGSIYWLPAALDNGGSSAERLAILSGAQIILWGHIAHYRDGVLVTPFVTVVDRTSDLRAVRPEQQIVATPAGEFRLSHPRTTLALDSIILPQALLNQYAFSKISLCKLPGRQCRLLNARYAPIRFLSNYENPARVKYKKQEYYLATYPLVQGGDPSLDFIEGLMALLREQPNRATCKFGQVTKNARTSTAMRSIAYYYAGMARLQRRECPLGDLLQSQRTSPSSGIMARALVIGYHAAICASGRARFRSMPGVDAQLKDAAQLLGAVSGESADRGLAGLLRLPI